MLTNFQLRGTSILRAIGKTLLPGLLKTARTEKQSLNPSTILTINLAMALNTKLVPNFLIYVPTKFQPYWIYTTGVMH